MVTWNHRSYFSQYVFTNLVWFKCIFATTKIENFSQFARTIQINNWFSLLRVSLASLWKRITTERRELSPLYMFYFIFAENWLTAERIFAEILLEYLKSVLNSWMVKPDTKMVLAKVYKRLLSTVCFILRLEVIWFKQYFIIQPISTFIKNPILE